MHLIKLASLFLLISFSIVNQSYAEVRRSDDGGGVAKAQQLLRQIAAERDVAKAEGAKLQAEIENLQKTIEKRDNAIKTAEKKIDKRDEVIAKLEQRGEKLLERIQKDRERMLEIADKFRETITVMKQIEFDKTQAQQELVTTKTTLDACGESNDKLAGLGYELLEMYKNKSTYDSIFQHESIIGLKKVEIEKLVQGKENDIRSLQFANGM